jgi:hypothetical protein
MSSTAVIVVLVAAVVAGLALAGGIVAVVVTVLRRQAAQDARPPAPVPAGWTAVGTDDSLVTRLGLDELFPGPVTATEVRTGTVGGFPVVVGVTPGRGWANERSSRTVTVHISGTDYTLCALRLPGALPSFNLLSESAAGRIATAAGLPDLDTESGDLNRERRIVSADDRLAHALLAPTVIAALQDGPADATLQVVGDQLVSFRKGRLDPAEVEARVAWLVRVASVIPAFVYDEQV